MNFILFNGPPRSGKDTAANIVYDHLKDRYPQNWIPRWEKFSFPNKRAFAGQMDVSIDGAGVVYPYEEDKEAIISSLGVSYRQWQIDYSEKFMKPLYGNDIFGRLLLDRADQRAGVIHVVSDCGFQIECDVLRDHNVLLIQLHRDGTSFEGDSREWVGVPDMCHTWDFYTIQNNMSLESLRQEVTHRVDEWLSKL